MKKLHIFSSIWGRKKKNQYLLLYVQQYKMKLNWNNLFWKKQFLSELNKKTKTKL